MSLALSARHRDMLACMGLPMQGWLVAEATAAPTTAPAQTLVVDTMNPAIRSLRLADLKNSEKITAESAFYAEKPALVAPKNIANQAEQSPSRQGDVSVLDTVAHVAADAVVVADTPVLERWSWQQRSLLAPTAPLASAVPMLLIERSNAKPGFPLGADEQALLANILSALGQTDQDLLLAVLPPTAADTKAVQAQLQAWQPAWLMLLGRQASRAALGEQTQTQSQAGSLSALRGQPFQLAGIAAWVSYPLGYLLRKPEAKAGAWQDWLAAQWQWDAAQNTGNAGNADSAKAVV